MKARVLAVIGMIAAVNLMVGSAARSQTRSATSLPRTPWGDPDLQGAWTNATATPLERPKDLEGKQVLTDRERTELDRQVARENSTDNAPPAGNVGSHNEFWRERGSLGRRTSLLVDPPDGRLPPLTPEGLKAQTLQAAAGKASPADGPESRNLFERCITRGMPGSMMGDFYNHNYHILQTPGYVVLSIEMIHDVRIIPLDGRPHVGTEVRQWLGDSRGRWEGNTLVVDTTNLRAVNDRNNNRMLGIILFGTSATGRVIERFTRLDAETIDYRITVDDPAFYTRAWTAAVPMSKLDGTLFEFACHEGNYGMTGILAGHRAEEKAAEATKK